MTSRKANKSQLSLKHVALLSKKISITKDESKRQKGNLLSENIHLSILKFMFVFPKKRKFFLIKRIERKKSLQKTTFTINFSFIRFKAKRATPVVRINQLTFFFLLLLYQTKFLQTLIAKIFFIGRKN